MTTNSENIENDKTYLSELYKVRQYSVTQFDKQISFIASGALILTIGFIEKVVPFDTAKCISLLIIAWGSFSLALMANLFSLIFSLNAIDMSIRSNEESGRTFNTIVVVLNWISIILISLGITFSVIFISLNIT